MDRAYERGVRDKIVLLRGYDKKKMAMRTIPKIGIDGRGIGFDLLL